MDVLIVTATILAGFATFALAALRFGVDSRIGIGDDRRRR